MASSHIAGWLCVAAGGMMLGACAASPTVPCDLQQCFAKPPQAAKPLVMWHWIGGKVSEEGAKLDLSWLDRVGVGGVFAFSGELMDSSVKLPRSPFMTPEWKKAFTSSMATAKGHDMQVGIAGSPGWSLTGGPWVAPADAMKKYVWSVTEIEGGTPFTGQLKAPPSATGPFLNRAGHSIAPNAPQQFYRDSFVIAFPTPGAERAPTPPSLISSAGPIDLSPLDSQDLSATIELPIAAGKQQAWIEARYPEPTTLSAVRYAVPAGVNIEIQASDDGKSFRTVNTGHISNNYSLDHPTVQQTLAFSTTARVFRIVFNAPPPVKPLPDLPRAFYSAPKPITAFTIAALAFESGARVDRFEAKAGFQTSLLYETPAQPEIPTGAIDPTQVVILSDKLTADGHLQWTPPPGRWTVMRFGWSLTGQANGPAEKEATGLEVDKLDPEAVRRYVATYLDLYQSIEGVKVGPDDLSLFMTDSWEAGFQNWTPALLQEFRKRRDYDPMPFVPVLGGRVVQSADASNRFLWDFRLTLKELMVDTHYGVLAEELRKRGMTFYAEANGDNPRALGDGLTMKARTDVPTGEYWYRNFASGPGQNSLKADLKESASAANLYGRRLAAVEGLTVAAGQDPFSFSPRMLKPVADEIFSLGINKFLIHESRHQPLVDAKPGLAMAIFGQYFTRNETWAEDAGPWVRYLARSSYLLQQGRFVSDIAYFYGEDQSLTEIFRSKPNTDVPPGHGYDYLNPESLLKRLSVRGGRLQAEGGASYRILLLPPHVDRLTLPALQRIRDLIEAGAVVAGARPVGGLGLRSPDADIRAIADVVWGTQQLTTEGRSFGKGKVYPTLAAALAGESIRPDVQFSDTSLADDLRVVHRRTDEAEIYFISNQSGRAANLDGTFRVSARGAELWCAGTGNIEPTTAYAEREVTRVPLRLAADEAVFVVFRRGTAPRVVPTSQDAESAMIDGPWAVSFEPNRGAPASSQFERLRSWTEAEDPGIRYFSGSATYRKSVSVTNDWLVPGERVELDLGAVHELAAVTINGKPVATLWRAPYRVDVTALLRPGDNAIELRLVNLWPNRLIGDKQPGATPIAYAPQSPYTKDSPLMTSGLLGPVRLIRMTRRQGSDPKAATAPMAATCHGSSAPDPSARRATDGSISEPISPSSPHSDIPAGLCSNESAVSSIPEAAPAKTHH